MIRLQVLCSVVFKKFVWITLALEIFLWIIVVFCFDVKILPVLNGVVNHDEQVLHVLLTGDVQREELHETVVLQNAAERGAEPLVALGPATWCGPRTVGVQQRRVRAEEVVQLPPA